MRATFSALRPLASHCEVGIFREECRVLIVRIRGVGDLIEAPEEVGHGDFDRWKSVGSWHDMFADLWIVRLLV